MTVCYKKKIWWIVSQMTREYAKGTGMYMYKLFMYDKFWYAIFSYQLDPYVNCCSPMYMYYFTVISDGTNAVLNLRRLGTNVNVNIKSIVKFAI